MSILDLLGSFAALIMGLSLGMIGGGGSILTVPILVYFFQINGTQATAQSLFIVGTTALIGALLNAAKKQIDLKIAILFSIPSLIGVAVSRRLILPMIPDDFSVVGLPMTKSILLLMAFAALMLIAAKAMIQSSGKNTVARSNTSLLEIATKGFFVGIITGFVGAGGGFLIVPALVLFLGLSMRMAVGTSLAIIALNSLFGFSVSLQEALPNWPQLLMITLLGAIGLFVGHRLAPLVPEKNLKKVFGYFVLVLGLFVFIDQGFRLFK